AILIKGILRQCKGKEASEHEIPTDLVELHEQQSTTIPRGNPVRGLGRVSQYLRTFSDTDHDRLGHRRCTCRGTAVDTQLCRRHRPKILGPWDSVDCHHNIPGTFYVLKGPAVRTGQ